MKVLNVFFIGISILIGAIILNALASRIGLMSWFEFAKNPKEENIISYIWLFIIYPFGLGLTAYLATKLFSL